jgi:tetratricopeptide (TPR) repeat protein
VHSFAQEQTPSEEQALQAYRQGEFARAVQLYTQALTETEEGEHKARLHVRIAWTLFALGREAEVQTHLQAAIMQQPELTLASDYYTQQFLDLFEEARRRALARRDQAGGGANQPDLEATLTTIHSRMDSGDDLEGALADVEKLAAAYPSDGRILPLRIQILELLGRSEEAEQLRQMHLLAGDSGGALAGGSLIERLSIPDLILRANRMLDEGDVNTSLELLREAVARQPSNVAALELMAEAARRAAHWKEAEFALKSALALQPDNIGLKLRLGEVYLAKQDASAARDVFRELADSHPRSDRAWASLGLLNATLGKHEEARTELERALSENPLLPEVQLAYGELLLAGDEIEKAGDALRAAANLLHEDPQLDARMGQTMLAKGRYENALPLLRSAIENGFDRPDVNRSFVVALIHLEYFSEASRVLLRLEQTGAASGVEVGLLTGLLNIKQGEYAEAETVLAPVLEAHPNDPQILNLLAAALYAQAKFDQALAMFQQARELDSSDPVIEQNVRRAEAAVAAVLLADRSKPIRPAASSTR